MKNPIIWIAILLVLLGGGYWLYGQSNPQVQTNTNDGAYEYVCANGSGFRMVPKEDLSSITLTPGGTTGAVSGTVVLMPVASEAGARFEGNGITFVGAGEEVTLTVSGAASICQPKPSADMAPWNWGDAGEGGGSIQPDVTIVVSESIQGKWQSTDDAKFVREFKSDGTFSDWHDNERVDDGTWKAFTDEKPLPVSFTLAANTVYLQLVTEHDQVDIMNFRVGKLTPEELQLVYMERGNVLNFKSIQ